MLWAVEQRNLWGDYGSTLISGLARRESEGGPLLLHRTGPFLPPISFPRLSVGGHRIVVSDDFRRELESGGFAGLQFKPTVKSRIIELNWHEWDGAAAEPKRYPSGGEPSGYIWDKSHNARIAAKMPEAWEFLPPVVPLRMERLKGPDGFYLDRYRAFPSEPSYVGLFLTQHQYGDLVVDEAARQWLENRVGEWVRFCEIELADAPDAGHHS